MREWLTLTALALGCYIGFWLVIFRLQDERAYSAFVIRTLARELKHRGAMIDDLKAELEKAKDQQTKLEAGGMK